MQNFNFVIYLSLWSCCVSFSQVSGLVTDHKDKTALIGANIVLTEIPNSENIVGTTTNFDGKYNFENIKIGNYQLAVSYIGYKTYEMPVSITNGKNQIIDIRLEKDLVLDVVRVIGDQAEFRKTPVSLSNVKLEKIERELGGQEIPMLLNSTPGVYATQQGGGDGDVRINIRGFNQ